MSMYSQLMANMDRDNLSQQCVLIYTDNYNDLVISTNDKSVFYEIMNWYQTTTTRQSKEKKPKTKFVQYHGILEGARKSSVFGDFFWVIPIVDKFLDIGCSVIGGVTQHPGQQTRQLIFTTNKGMMSPHSN